MQSSKITTRTLRPILPNFPARIHRPQSLILAVKLMRKILRHRLLIGTAQVLVVLGLGWRLFATPATGPGEFSGNIFIDPANKGIWSVIGPNGGDVRSVAIDPKDKDRIYISTMDGQIHVSFDGGKNWRMLVRFDRPQLILDQLIVDSEHSNIIYASGHRGNLPGGFFCSKDGGATWKEAKDLRNEAIHAMTQAAADPKTLFVGSKNGIFVSRDRGESWSKIESPDTPINLNSLAVDPRDLGTIYAGTSWRPYKSTDNGKSWRLIKNGMIDDSDIFAITIDSRDTSHIIASACSGIYESFNGGENWKKIQGIPSTSRRTRDILQHPTRPGTIYAATTEGFWMTTNGGVSWSQTLPKTFEINSVAVHPDAPDRVFVGTNNYGVWLSNDGGRTFAPTNNSFSSRLTYSVVADVELPDRLYSTTLNTSSSGGFFFHSSDGGKTWTQARGLDVNRDTPYAILQDQVNPNLIYLGTNKGVFRSLDRGVSFSPIVAARAPARRAPTRGRNAPVRKAVSAEPVSKEPNLVPALSDTVKVLAFTADNKSGILAGTNKGLFRSYDVTKGWERISFGGGLDENVFAVHVNPAAPSTIWVGTARSGVIVSYDDGKTWEKTNAAPENVPVSSIASDPKRPDYVYVGTIQAFYLSRDGGKTWKRRGGNLPLGNFTSILVDPNDNDTIIISSALETDGGVFISEDAGMKWRRFDSKEFNLPTRRIWSLIFDPANPRRMYAATHSSGIYRIERTGESSASK